MVLRCCQKYFLVDACKLLVLASLTSLFTALQIGMNQSSSARVRRDSAARAMQGWHAHRLLTNGIYGDQMLKVKKILLFVYMYLFKSPTI